jgi:hypothetical protein
MGFAEANVESSNPSDPSGASRAIGFLSGQIVHGVALFVSLATVVLAGQPIYANDTWIHLALGEAFSAAGPWLSADPYLFAAPGPPAPSSWLGSVAIFQIQQAFGFQGLRVIHALSVAGILGLVWALIRRVCGSARAASAGVVFFILLSTYRLVQLRPDLFTIGAALVVVLLLIVPREGPGRSSILAAAVLSLVWSNVHAAFLLGPLLVLGVSATLFLFPLLRRLVIPGLPDDPSEHRRATRIGIAGGAMLIASLANPQGWTAHLAYFNSGGETLALAAVADEWGPTNLLVWPASHLPPTPAAWLICWLCVLGVGIGGVVLYLDLRRRASKSEADPDTPTRVDPALLALAVAGIVAAVLASRFLFLCVFGVALLAVLASCGVRSRLLQHTIAAVTTLAVILSAGLHFSAGDWPLVSRSLLASRERYAEPYFPGKYHGHSMWFLADSGVQGRIYNAYTLGGFMSFWLSPRLQMASSGTMNVELEAMEANLAIEGRRPLREGEDFAALLDQQGFDLFLGTGLPVEGPAHRPISSTVRHLEREPGWIPVFRSLRNIVYLRRNERNAENLDRIRSYYEAQGVPFDPERGFSVERAIVKAPEWSIQHGIIPFDFKPMLESVRNSRASRHRSPDDSRLAAIYAILGLYDRALQVDRSSLRFDRTDTNAAQRILWCLFQLRRQEELLETARTFADGPLSKFGAGEWSVAIDDFLERPPSEQATLVPLLPLLSAEEVPMVRNGVAYPLARARGRSNFP